MDIARLFLDHSRLFLNNHLHAIQECMLRLSNDDIWWRPNEESNSIGNLILHMSGSLYQWIVTGIGGAADHRIRQQEFDERSLISKDELLSKLNSTVSEADAVLAQIDPARLLEKIQVQGNQSWMFAIYHMIEHFASHTGQIILITKFRKGEDLSLS